MTDEQERLLSAVHATSVEVKTLLIALDKRFSKHEEDDEEAHFMMLQEAVMQMGADPTAQTPDADVSGVASQGFMQVLTDPRTSIVQGLEMLLSIELIDNAGWELLIILTDEMKIDTMTGAFQRAWEQEETHLQRVRMWYEQGIRGELMRAAAMK